MINGVKDEVHKLGRDMIREEWESYDDILRQHRELRKDWSIIKKDEVTRKTTLGGITYSRTLFINKKTGCRAYLLDRILGFEQREYITEDAKARICEEAVETCYRKGGLNACINGELVTKETVMNILHSLEFPEILNTSKETG
ncbi:MAG: UPF0236 family protein [Lachnospiraceae bacterium]|nr:UPF0236 family protein [Lachnospiraceae bacterium]